jgi:hypothetical protein
VDVANAPSISDKIIALAKESKGEVLAVVVVTHYRDPWKGEGRQTKYEVQYDSTVYGDERYLAGEGISPSVPEAVIRAGKNMKTALGSCDGAVEECLVDEKPHCWCRDVVCENPFNKGQKVPATECCRCNVKRYKEAAQSKPMAVIDPPELPPIVEN